MAEQFGRQRNDLSGQFGSHGGPQFNGVVFETGGAPINISYANLGKCIIVIQFRI